MAKKLSAAPERGSPGRSTSEISTVPGKSQRNRLIEAAAGQETRAPQTAKISLARRTGEGRGEGHPSALLDTHVIYCGDNLEQAGRTQKDEGSMMKPARLPILPSSFILLNSRVPASHYVKVMLDQIFVNGFVVN